jgi:peptidoglycan/xylan/chitin deacetylase (PgdA/CDA1 family)
MQSAGFRRHVQDLRLEASYFARRRYPRFVTSRNPPGLGAEVPVFVHHTIEPEPFEEQLQFLRENGYHTATAGELHDHLTGARPLPADSVVITIDDGRTSVYTHAYPLLQKFGMRATVFLIPGYIPEQGPPLRTLADSWSGACNRSDVRHRDPAVMDWAQIRTLAGTGVFDFQSHTLYHHRIPTGPRIVDFFRPDLGLADYDVPVPDGYEARLCMGGAADLLGLPIYENESLMSGRLRYIPDPRLGDACLEYVASRGGASFFAEESWRKTLHQWVEQWRTRSPDTGRYQSPQENEDELVSNLRQAREMISHRIAGTEVVHLCYPYGAGSPRSVRASRAAGYRTNFWAVRERRRSNHPGDDPFGCPRLKADYVFRLPGRNRRPLAEIFASKLKRRVECRPVY